jgi:hypothetical protein
MSGVATAAKPAGDRSILDSWKPAAIAGGVAVVANTVPFSALAAVQKSPGSVYGARAVKATMYAIPYALAAGVIDYNTHRQLESGKQPKHLLATDALLGAAAGLGGALLLHNNGLVPFEAGNGRFVRGAVLGALAGSLMYAFEPKAN